MILFQSLSISIKAVNLYVHHLAMKCSDKNLVTEAIGTVRSAKHVQDNRNGRFFSSIYFRAGTWQASARPAGSEFVSVAS